MFKDRGRFLRRLSLAAALALGGIPGVAGAQPQPAEQPQPDEAQDTGAADPFEDPDQGTADQPQGPATPDTRTPAGLPPPSDEPVPTGPAIPVDTLVDVDVEQPVGGEGEVIVVTGSIIERRDLTTPAPVSIVNKEALDASGLVSIGDILQNLPSQSNAINIQFNNGGTGATRISMRGLGANRTLVLVNGRRHVPGGNGADASVDLNAIPLAIIERVEVLKDGASAIYGSDAIGGVVNIITRKNFEGTETSLYLGSTGDGKGEILDLSVATGVNSRKGNIVFAAGYYHQGSVGAGDRDFSRSDKFYDWDTGEVSNIGSSGVPQGFLRDRLRAPGNEAWQAVLENCTMAAQRGCYLDPTTGWRDFNFDGNSDVGEGDYYNYQPENHLVTPQKRFNLFSSGSHEFHDHVRGFFEASYTNRTSDQTLAPEPLFTLNEGLRVSADNYYNPFGRDFIDIRRRLTEAGNRIFSQDNNTFRFVGGVEGTFPDELSLPKGWRWNLAYNYGRTDGTVVNEGRLVRDRIAGAIGPSYVDDQGNIRCGTPDSPGPLDCVPLNLFGGEGTITDEMMRYLTYTGTAHGYTEQKSVLFGTTGRLFRTPWGGDAALAIGLEYRQEEGAFQPDPLTASGNTTGNKGEPTLGGFDVYEAYGELSVVPVVGKELAEWVELNAAVRGFDYSTFGSGATWKAGGLWRMIKGVAVRGTYSTAFRAPSIGQLFAGQSDAFPNVTDPCDTSRGTPSENQQMNCAADGVPADYSDDRIQLPARVGGNPRLEIETANIFTAGAVYEPHFLPGFAATVDYFNIHVDNSIQSAGASVILSNCYGQPTALRSDCDKIIRDPTTHLITRIVNLQTNIGSAATAGVDFNFRYDHITNVGRFRHNLEGTWLQKYNETQADGRVVEGKNVYDLGVHPDWKFNFSTIWGLDAYGAGVNMRFINGFKECKDNDCAPQENEAGETVDALSRPVTASLTADLFGSYTLKSSAGTSKFTVGINNILNTPPAIIYNGFLASSDASSYDYLGRYFYARFVQMF